MVTISSVEPTRDIEVLKRWIGSEEYVTDCFDVRPARFMEMTLDREPALQVGDELPELWHWLYFLRTAPLSELGPDGHPALGGFLPPVALARRLWAGGRLQFHQPLILGTTAERRSIIQDVSVKEGRSGLLCFVTVRHEILVDGDVALTEEHDIVYRNPVLSQSQRAHSETSVESGTEHWPWQCSVEPSEVMLFRYSALTFNGHRIHYDRDYAVHEEGHQGLVFHGPLTATLLLDLARREQSDRRIKRFEFRALNPLYDDQAFRLCGLPTSDRARLQALTPDGRVAVEASAHW